MVYNHFAQVYDHLMNEAPYDEWAVFTEQVLSSKGVTEPVTILDLGCGTGEISLRLSKQGRQLIGVDLSADMLTVAQNKASLHNANVQWIKQDARELQGFTDIDVCVSYCDVINYLTSPEDIETVFANVYQSLKENGLFIFDIHELEYAKQSLMNHTFAESDEDLSYIWECEAGLEEGQMYHYLTFFQRTANDYYSKFEEEHEQKVFPLEYYLGVLKNVGFNKIEFSSDFKLENSISSKNRVRNFIIAEK